MIKYILELPTIKIEDENKYTQHDLPRLNIMKKICSNLNTLHMLLRPYFEDYEQVFYPYNSVM